MTKKTFSGDPGFTMVELLIVLVLIGLVVSVGISVMRPDAWIVSGEAAAVTADLADIESAALAYRSDKGEWPAGLGDAAFVPAYLFPPKAPKGFDRAFGAGGYDLGMKTDGAAGENGLRICLRFSPADASDVAWRALERVSGDMADGRFFVADACGATAETPLSAGSDMYATYWVFRN